MERLFQLLAVVLIGIAVFFYSQGNHDGMFASVVFGCAAFFLAIRSQAKRRVERRNAEILEEKYGAAGEGVLPEGEPSPAIEGFSSENKKEKLHS